jgi:hypothetical protein
MSETNRLQAQRPCANAPLFLPATIKGLWGFCGLWSLGVNTSQYIPLIGFGKARVVTECNAANGGGWNAASRFGFELRVVGGKVKGERNETAGWPECNGMKEALLRG